MIYETIERKTDAYLWNTGIGMDLKKGDRLSDFTGLQEEFDEKTLKETFEWVKSRNKELEMEQPKLMLVTTGESKSCHVWIDLSILNPLPEVEDPKKTFEYYCED